MACLKANMAIKITVVSEAKLNRPSLVIFLTQKLRPRPLGNFPQFP
jgi:hypothetical protein